MFFDQYKKKAHQKKLILADELRSFLTTPKLAKLEKQNNIGSEILEIICQEKLKNLSEGAKKLFSVLCFLQMGFR